MRIGLIGAGQFGRKHLETIRNEPRCELAGVADPAWQGEKRYADYREMLDRAKPDGVIIATPNALHVPAGLACIERGCRFWSRNRSPTRSLLPMSWLPPRSAPA